LVLSRKGREELKEYPLTLALSRGVEREEGRLKDFNNTPHPNPLPQGGEGRRKMKRFKQYPSPLPSPAGGEG
jgi:hypothetical protein